MRRTVVISSTSNDDYLFFLPIICWAWNRLGWDVMCFTPLYGDKSALSRKYCTPNNTFIKLPEFEGYRIETISQCIRLYGHVFTDYSDGNPVLMTSDIDMLPLSDYWNPDPNEITCYGRDLSDKHYPICYIAMDIENWQDVVGNNMLLDLENSKAKSNSWSEWWQVDQDIITTKLSNQIVNRIDRSIAPNSHYPLGRIDRGCWDCSLKQPLRIDAHLLRPGYTEGNWNKILELIHECFNPTKEEINWMMDYRNDYIKWIK